MQKIRRYIAIYEKHGERLVAEKEISQNQFVHLRALLGLPDSNKCFDCYPVGYSHLKEIALEGIAQLSEENRDYFLEAEAE